MQNGEKRTSFIESALKHRQVTVTVCLLLCLAGAYSLFTMPRQEFPEFKQRTGLVIAVFPGADPRQVDEQVAKPLQNYLFSFKEVNRRKTYSESKQGQAVVYVEVNDNIRDTDEFWAKLRLGLADMKSRLPPQVLAVVGISDFGDASAVLLTITSKERSYRELEHYMEKLEDRLRTNEAVSKIQHFGLQKEQITVYVDPARLAHYGVKPAMLISALQLEGMLGYGGSVKTPDLELPINLPPRFNSEAEVAEQIIYASPTGEIVRVKDVATVKREYDIEDSYVEANGAKALVVSMEARFGHNIVKFGEEVDKVIDGLKKEMPTDIQISKAADMPATVQHSISRFFEDFALAILSVVLVTVILLPRRIALVAAVTIPICVLITLLFMQLSGTELNTISLASMVVVLGMIVDNAIVIIDNHVEKLDHGVGVWEAAWTSASELAVPVFSATIAIVLAFATERLFLTGMGYDFVLPMVQTVAIALGISFVIAVLLVPTLSWMYIKKGIRQEDAPGRKPSMLERMQSFYDRLLDTRIMTNPKRAVAGGAIAILAGLALFALVPQQLFPTLERNQFAVEIYFKKGTSLQKNGRITRKLAEILRKDERITDVISFVGTSSPRFHTLYAPKMPSSDYSQILVVTRTNKETEEVLREYDAKYRKAFPEAHVRWKQLSFLPANAPIEIRLSGDSLEEVKKAGGRVKALLEEEKDILWARDDFRETQPTALLSLDRESANRLGVTRGLLGMSVAMNRNGVPVSTVWEGDYQRSVVLKYDKSKSSSPEKLNDQYVGALLSPRPVLLRQVAKLKPGFTEGQVVRRNGRITMTISGDVAFGELASPILSRMDKKIKKLGLPPSIAVTYGGEDDMIAETFIPFSKALVTSMLLIFIVLLFQFKTVRLALLIMATMPLSLIGVALGLHLLGYPFGLTAFGGLIALFGTVVRNGIILISYAHEIEAKGMSVKDAATAAGKRRLRPIFLTANAAALGVVPLIFSGSLLWGPLGTVICFGLIGSTILTLLVLPAAYALYGEKEEHPEL